MEKKQFRNIVWLIFSIQLILQGCYNKISDTIFFDVSSQDKILFVKSSKSGLSFVVVDNNGKDKLILRDKDSDLVSLPNWSFNMRYIVYSKLCETSSFLNGIWLLDIENYRLEQLIKSSPQGLLDEIYSYPKFNSNGDRIAFVRTSFKEKNKKDLITKVMGYKELWLIDVSTKKERPLVTDNIWEQFEWRGNQQIFFLKPSKRNLKCLDIWMVDLTTGKKKQITKNERVYYFTLSPDGEKMLYLTSSRNKLNILDLNIDGYKKIKKINFEDITEYAKWIDNENIAILIRNNKNEKEIWLYEEGRERKMLTRGKVLMVGCFSISKQVVFLREDNSLWVVDIFGNRKRLCNNVMSL